MNLKLGDYHISATARTSLINAVRRGDIAAYTIAAQHIVDDLRDNGLKADAVELCSEAREMIATNSAIMSKVNGSHLPALALASEPIDRITGARMDWTGLQGKDPPRRHWWIDHWLSPVPTLLAGQPGIGKTLLAQQVASALALGQPSFAPFVADRPLRSLIWACEDDHDELWRRQVNVCYWLGAPIDSMNGVLEIEPRGGLQNTLMGLDFNRPVWAAPYEYLREQVNDLKIDILWLDNITQTFGGNENDAHQVSFFVNGIAGLVRDRPFCPVMLGHPSRAVGSEFAGSRAWEAAVRMRWYLGANLPDKKTEEDDVDAARRYLCKRKTNYSQKDYVELAYRDGALWSADTTGVSKLRHTPQQAADVVLRGFRALCGMGLHPADGYRSGDYLPRQLADKKMNEGMTTQELRDGMNFLMRDGRLVRTAVGTYSNRTPRLGLREVK